jgi:hypothetical protein
MMVPLNDVAERATAPSLGGLSNEALQQTRSASTSIAAALAAERWCSADCAGPERSTAGARIGP